MQDGMKEKKRATSQRTLSRLNFGKGLHNGRNSGRWAGGAGDSRGKRTTLKTPNFRQSSSRKRNKGTSRKTKWEQEKREVGNAGWVLLSGRVVTRKSR